MICAKQISSYIGVQFNCLKIIVFNHRLQIYTDLVNTANDLINPAHDYINPATDILNPAPNVNLVPDT